MLSSISRIPPPPLLELSFPSAPLLAEDEHPLPLGVKGATYSDRRAVTKPRTKPLGLDYPVIPTNSGPIRRLIDLLYQVHTEMEHQLVRVRTSIAEAEEDIKQLRAERAHHTDMPVAGGITGYKCAELVVEDGDARRNMQIH